MIKEQEFEHWVLTACHLPWIDSDETVIKLRWLIPCRHHGISFFMEGSAASVWVNATLIFLSSIIPWRKRGSPEKDETSAQGWGAFQLAFQVSLLKTTYLPQWYCSGGNWWSQKKTCRVPSAEHSSWVLLSLDHLYEKFSLPISPYPRTPYIFLEIPIHPQWVNRAESICLLLKFSQLSLEIYFLDGGSNQIQAILGLAFVFYTKPYLRCK